MQKTFRHRLEALGNRRAGTTTGEWSAHKLPRRLVWLEVGRTGTGLKETAREALLSALTPIARSADCARQSPPASLPLVQRKGKSLGLRKNRSLEPMTL